MPRGAPCLWASGSIIDGGYPEIAYGVDKEVLIGGNRGSTGQSGDERTALVSGWLRYGPDSPFESLTPDFVSERDIGLRQADETLKVSV